MKKAKLHIVSVKWGQSTLHQLYVDKDCSLHLGDLDPYYTPEGKFAGWRYDGYDAGCITQEWMELIVEEMKRLNGGVP